MTGKEMLWIGFVLGVITPYVLGGIVVWMECKYSRYE